MSELDDWAQQVGYKTEKQSKARAWLDANPDRVAQIREARERGWSWLRVCEFLNAKGFPFSETSLQNESVKMGIR